MIIQRLLLVAVLILAPIISFGQSIENIDFDVKNDKVIVTYDLKSTSSHRVYDIGIQFKTRDGETIYPKEISGDLKKVSPGNNKRIVWDVLAGGQEMKGSMSAVVTISSTHSTKVVGGPSNAFLTLLVPGLGDHYVNQYSKTYRGSYSSSSRSHKHHGSSSNSNNINYSFILPLGYWLCAAGAGVEYFHYTDNYSKYHKATIQTDMDKFYGDANTNYQNAQIYAGVAVTLLLTDVIYVAVKGAKNRHQQLRSYASNDPKFKLYLAGNSNNFQIGISRKL